MDLLDSLSLVASSPWAYALVAVIAALDALIPVVPSEATLIAAGAFAGAGELKLGLVVLAGAVGAFAGDNLSYTLGRLGRRRLPERSLRAAAGMLAARGGLVIVVARFIPGGRTAATLAAGATMPRRRFLRLAAIAAAAWGSYGGLLGYVGGRTFEEEPWKAIVVGLLLAGALTLLFEGARLLARRAGGHSGPCGATT